jgi:apolipoprotein N-acyltransferase
MLACALALVILGRPRRELAWLLMLVALPLLPALPGPSPGTIAARVVQPNVDTETDWTTERVTALEKRMELLSHAPGVDLIVWPEVPAPFYPSTREFHEFLTRVARDSNAPVLFWRRGSYSGGGAFELRVPGR